MGAEGGQSNNPPRRQSRLNERQFVHRVLISVGFVVLVALLLVFVWKTIDVLLLVFAGILFGLILNSAAGRVSRYTRLKHGWALLVTILFLFGLATGLSLIAAPQVSDQFIQLRERLPQAIQRLSERVQQTTWGKYVMEKAPAPADIAASTGKFFSSITSVFSKTLEVIVAMLVIFVVTIYTAVDPELYINGFLHLVPKDKRLRARQILRDLGHTLRY